MLRFESLLVSRVRENRTHGLNGGPTGILLHGEKEGRVYQ
jgi:hypothetical protein